MTVRPAGDGATRTDGSGGPARSRAAARAGRVLPVQVLRAHEVPVELRGAGPGEPAGATTTPSAPASRSTGSSCARSSRPGGNWSSYPPHKHDAHSDVPGHEERELEEIYYFEVADGSVRARAGYHRVYGTPDRPIDVVAEVRTGDTVLVPHGYHGPSIAAAPGYDLYYLNVMAGPADDGAWLSVDDPAHDWVRTTWETRTIDPRLPFGREPT